MVDDGGLMVDKICEQRINCNMGGRYRVSLCLFMVAGTNPADVRLCAGNVGRIKKMFMADMAGIEGLDGADGDFNRLAGGIHRRAGCGF
jgi:hypothetical protein